MYMPTICFVLTMSSLRFGVANKRLVLVQPHEVMSTYIYYMYRIWEIEKHGNDAYAKTVYIHEKRIFR